MGKKSFKLIGGIIIFMIFIGFASAIAELQWADGTSAKLLRNDEIAYKYYSVKVVGFPPPVESDKYNAVPAEPVTPFVELNVSKNNTFIETIVLGPSESHILPDSELKITAIDLPSKNAKEWIFESYAPWATIELNPRGIPSLGLSLRTDKDKYTLSSDTDIVAVVELKNTGSADAVNVDMNIETELPIMRGSLSYHYERIKKGETIKENITFALPILSEQKMYSISANVSGYDAKDIPYAAKLLKIITVAPEPQKGISIRKTTVNKMYLKDYTLVSLYLKNNGMYDLKNVSITDSLPSSFELMGNGSLNWTIDIPAYGEWDYHYPVRPLEPSEEGIVFPAATAEFKIKNELYSIRSNQPRTVVNGAKVVLQKQADVTEVNLGDVVNVTVVAENTGSTPTKIAIMDELPKNITIISGSTMRKDFLEANRKISFNYTFRVNYLPIKLPPATADYYELGTTGKNISVTSKGIEIKVKPKIIATPTPTPVPTIVEIPQDSTNSSAFNVSDDPLMGLYIFLISILGCNDGNNHLNDAACKLFANAGYINSTQVRFNGSISSASTARRISFTNLTPPNGAILTQKYAYINTSVSDVSTAFIDWNRSLVGWWRFNVESGENSAFFRDWSSWGNNASCSGTSCPASTSGKFGNALNFDGSNDYVDEPNSASLNPSNITLEAWFNANSGGLRGQKPLLQKPYTSHVAPYYQYMLSLTDTSGSPKSADFYLAVNGITRYVEVKNLSYNYGEWHYLAGTYNGSTMTMYLDGNVVGTTPIVGTITSYNTILEFGAYPNNDKNPSNVFNGKIDEIRIHSRALSPDEIKASYNAGIYRLYNNFTNLANGVYSYKAYAQSLPGTVFQTETRTLKLPTR